MREGTRSVGPFTAIWYAVFMIPFFLWVREPRAEVVRGASVAPVPGATWDAPCGRCRATSR